MPIVVNGEHRVSRLHQEGPFDFGMYRATANKRFYEPQRTTDFELIITGFGPNYTPGDPGIYNVLTGKRLDGATEVLRYAVTECDIPHYKVGVQEQRRGNSVQKYAGTASFDSGTLKVRDWIGSDSKSILMSWLNQAYDVKTDKTGLLEDYKRDCTLIEYTPDRQPIREWRLYGCWVSDVSEDSWNHDSDNGERQLTATLQFDRAVMALPNEYVNNFV